MRIGWIVSPAARIRDEPSDHFAGRITRKINGGRCGPSRQVVDSFPTPKFCGLHSEEKIIWLAPRID
jgi:hypothetical protein